ncbi:hypothetical protein OCUBac02_09360 [Bosea sp. ANAM02]|nr:hypothetical protein OCUBac02_09360 [Bosea sp. ANAM02]
MANDYRDIVSVPRDGSLVWVMHEDVGSFLMRWNAAASNPMVSTEPGIWEAPDGSFTWCDKNGLGPSHWRPE